MSFYKWFAILIHIGIFPTLYQLPRTTTRCKKGVVIRVVSVE